MVKIYVFFTLHPQTINPYNSPPFKYVYIYKALYIYIHAFIINSIHKNVCIYKYINLKAVLSYYMSCVYS